MTCPTGHLGFLFFINNQGLYPFFKMFTCGDTINHNTEYGRYFLCSCDILWKVSFLCFFQKKKVNGFRKFTSIIFSLWKGKCKRTCVCRQILNSSMWSLEKLRSAVSYWNVNCEAEDCFQKGLKLLATLRSIYNSKKDGKLEKNEIPIMFYSSGNK